nr:trafficking protein particle complex subunit 11 [Onthophagus taurus]
MQGIVDYTDLPWELSVTPQVLVGLSGLDTLNNAIHKSIWDTFTSNRRVERAPVQFKLIDNAHEFPVVKPKRNSYEWYIPKGLLKKNWMNKYLNEVPAVIVIFYDLDWNDVLWNEKMIECASRVQSMRAALEGRNTRLTVVLIQSTPLPPGEDMIASERATALCTSCDLSTKSLFVLPHVDHLQGYAIRLENAFYDLGQTFYHQEARNIKSHREHLNKSTHQYLFVRHQFKMGFLNELRQDNHTAHKHYTHAYNNLLEIRIVDTNANEIRMVAGFINYKLCRLMFTLNLPRDAISQFRSHVDRFKNRIGFRQLAFEHYAWIAKQYSLFGDIFDEAVKQGLPAVQTQHPGLYYQQAAQFIILRRKLCHDLCGHVLHYPNPDPLQGASTLEFYGQRPWRPGKVNAEPPDPHLENNGIISLQFMEKQINHSNIIIALYGLAISQYKTYRCSRTRRHLVVQMAEEYFNAKDYGKALTLFSHMLCDYREEKWWGIIKTILLKAIKCAFITVNIQDYLVLSLEILSTYIEVEPEHKKKTYENFIRVLNGQLPETEVDLPSEKVQQAVLMWQQTLSSKPLYFQVEIGNVVCAIDVKCRFLNQKYEADNNIVVEIFLKSLCQFPFMITKVALFVKTPGFSSEVVVDQRNTKKFPNGLIILNPNESKKVAVDFYPDPNDVGHEMQITGVHIYLGSSQNCVLDIKFPGVGNAAQHQFPQLQHFCLSPKNMPDFDNIKPQLSVNITPRHSNLDLIFKHENPSLIGEWYKITTTITNKEQHDIKDINIEINLSDDDSLENIEFSTKDTFEIEKLPLLIKMDKLEKLKETNVQFYIRSFKIGEKLLKCKVSFLLATEKPIASIKEDSFHLSTVKPFEISTKFLSGLFENVNKFYVEEEFVTMIIINSLSPWPLFIEESSLELTNNFENSDPTLESQTKGNKLNEKESGTEIYLVNPKRQSDKHTDIGQYKIKWNRLNGFSTTTEITLSGLPIEWMPLDMKLTLPEHGLVRTPLLVLYHFINKSHQLIQLDLSMEGNDVFMYAGYKQAPIHILPNSEKIIEYNLYPLTAGSVGLPRLLLNIPENSTEGPALRQEQLNLLIERRLPKYLFVMPQVKGDPISQEHIPVQNITVQ